MAYTTIDDPSAYFKVKAYAGDGNDGNAITFDDTDTNMQPDMVWLKGRTFSDNHTLYDQARGTNKYLHPDTTSIQYTNSSPNFGVKSFDSDGFTLGAWSALNRSSEDHIAWCWKANGSGSANSDGNTTTTTTSANTTSGLSIITYEGDGAAATLGHGLGAVPHFIIQKNIDDSENWQVYHHKNTSAPETDYLTLNTTNATGDQSSRWNDTAPTSTLITIGSDSSVSQSGESMVMYAWSEKQGYSKFGSYTGNGADDDGPFIYLGFRPSFVLIKRSSATESWVIWDTTRNTYNPMIKSLVADSTNAEDTTGSSGYLYLDALSNGFKITSTSAGNGSNASGSTYIYAAFAEAPFVNSNGVPCNAR